MPPIPNPGVRFPPPLVYAAGIAAGWLVDRRWPLPMTVAEPPVREILADLCFLLWLALMVWAFVTFRRARTSVIPNQPASAIVTNGPYRFTRNPMYVSLVALYLAVTLALDSWWPLLFLPLVVLVIQRAVIAREERYLASAFPADYEAYRRRVRRWL
ncbi:MAG TPA: isoprenylcysteine carboxylmethyltransferase family protein [Gemmatimonadaceae bacterium]|nr:isoprenylcysteine carboxylmethyltransferase family protein [Gemmatimonadaceae bacterium]